MTHRFSNPLASVLPIKAETPHRTPPSAQGRTFVTLAMQRSGQHAVINWLCKQIQQVVHFNYCHFERRKLRYWICPINRRVISYGTDDKVDSGIQDLDQMSGFLDGIERYRHLLYSFEEFDLEDRMLARYISENRPTVILILRDPYNWLASTLEMADYPHGQLVEKRNLLLKYLLQATGQGNYFNCPVVAISYNRWVQDEAYRRNLCAELGLPFSTQADQSIYEVPDFGGGSSFDGAPATFRNRDKVLHRWEQYISHPLYRKLLDHQQLEELSRTFFGAGCPFSDSPVQTE